MKPLTLLDLLSAGVHFGHQNFRRNPKMDRFIYTQRGGVSIFDLQQTATHLQSAFDFVVDLVARGGTIMFLGTKDQAKDVVVKLATEADMPYINQRWLGGTFTNFETMYRRIKRLRELETAIETGDLEKYTKRERLQIEREVAKMKKDFGGISKLDKVPDAIFVIGVNKEKIAVHESKKKGIVVVGIVDSNCNPEGVQYLIPGNDDAVKSIELIGNVIVEAVKEGRARAAAKATADAAAQPVSAK